MDTETLKRKFPNASKDFLDANGSVKATLAKLTTTECVGTTYVKTSSLVFPASTVGKFSVFGEPMGKPRMTRADKWKKRDCVMRYRDWCNKARAVAGTIKAGEISFKAYLEIPKSWSKKKKLELKNKPHQQTPDVDNIAKGLLDALFENDCHVWKIAGEKRWDDGNGPRLEVSFQ